MKLLVIFDNAIDPKDLLRHINAMPQADSVTLLPLTGRHGALKELETGLSGAGRRVTSLDSVKIIYGQIGILREKICDWVADIGESKAGRKTVKEWFILPGHSVSAWWFSLISEKNTFKTDVFLRIAQVNAVKEILMSCRYDQCAIALSHETLKKAIITVANKSALPVKAFPVQRKDSLASLVRKFAERSGAAGYTLLGLLFAIRYLVRSFIARIRLGDIRRRLPGHKSLLFALFFPGLDGVAAGKDVFRSRYVSVLHDKLKELEIPVTWLLMYTPIDGYGFNDAVRLAADLAKRGEKLFMAEEFLTMKNFFAALRLWFRQVSISGYVFSFVDGSAFFNGPVGEESRPFIKELWNASFCGPKGIDGIINYFVFKEVFKRTKNVESCLYPCEMQAWEKALNAGKSAALARVRTIAYQHSSVSRNYFFYFYGKRELQSRGDITDMPLPDMIAPNGEFSRSLFVDAGYRNVEKVEAIRYGHINAVLAREARRREGKPVLLVAGSINNNELLNLVAMAHAAFPNTDKVDVWFKWHPHMAGGDLFKELGIDAVQAGYSVRTDNISQCLKKAWAVLVPTGTVAVEALAYGCEVIIPIFADCMPMSPLADFEEYYHKARTPLELASIMEKIAAGRFPHNPDKIRDFIRKYWYLDETLPRWARLLTGSGASRAATKTRVM